MVEFTNFLRAATLACTVCGMEAPGVDDADAEDYAGVELANDDTSEHGIETR